MQSSPPPPLACAIRGDALNWLRHSDVTIYITGCSGWFGRCLLEALVDTLGHPAFQRRVRPFTSSGRAVRLRNGLEVATRPFDSLTDQDDAHSVLLNFAYLTKEQAAGMPLDDYLAANRRICDTVFAALDRLGCRGLLMPSSGAVYRPDVRNASTTTSNAYGQLKLADEDRALAWAAGDTARRAVVCRVFNVSGPYINKYSDYALSSIIDSTLKGEPIRIRTPRRTLRSYVAVDELLSLFLGMLLAPSQESVVFDSAGDTVLEINDLVTAVADTLGRTVPLERPPLQADEDRYLGARAPYAALLDRYHVAPVALPDQIRQTADYIRQFPGH